MTNRPEATSEEFITLSEDKTADSEALISIISEALLEKKAKKIVLLDVRELTSLTDYFVVCHGTSETQIKALADHVIEETRKNIGEKVWKMEGMDARRWIILDYVNVVVHIFSEEKRDYYGIERMWNDAERSEINDTP